MAKVTITIEDVDNEGNVVMGVNAEGNTGENTPAIAAAILIIETLHSDLPGFADGQFVPTQKEAN